MPYSLLSLSVACLAQLAAGAYDNVCNPAGPEFDSEKTACRMPTRRLHAEQAIEISDTATRSLQDVAAWVADNGGTVSPHILGTSADYDGFKVRGVGASRKIEQGEVLFDVPKKLWLHSDHFPEFQTLQLPGTANCNKSRSLESVLLSLAVAVETNKGNESFWAPYLRHLPTLDDYRSYHPILTDAATAEEFRDLAFVRKILWEGSYSRQRRLNYTLMCIQELQATAQPLPEGVATLTGADILRANMHMYARGFHAVPYSTALIPLGDLLNTERSEAVNTYYATPRHKFTLRLRRDVEKHGELNFVYCNPKCDNYDLMWDYGLYMSFGAKKLEKSHRQGSVDCPQTLRDITERYLSEKWSKGMTAPLCRLEALSHTRGPLRCALARLAYETCSKHWQLRQLT